MYVSLPSDFIATKYPGYFFNTADEKLYSMKIDGVLKPLKFYRPNPWNHISTYPIKLQDGSEVKSIGGYYVSFRGMRKFYAIERLKDLESVKSVIPIRASL